MPPVLDPNNLYAADGPGRFSRVVRGFRPLVYVPNSKSSSVDVIDPRTFRIVRHFAVGRQPQHVTPSWDLRRLWVVGTLRLRQGSMPQDVKLSPDGRVFYVADMASGGVWLVDGGKLEAVGFVHTGAGAHGLYASRDARYLYVSNRGEGSVSLVSFTTRKVARTWRLPGGGSPDMGGVSADGKVLWLSGRYDAEVYAIDTWSGRLLARIPVGQGPHGLCVSTAWPLLPGPHRRVPLTAYW